MNPFSAEHGHYPTTLFSQSRSVVFNASIGRMDRDKQQTANREFPDPCLPYAKTATQRKHNATLCLCLYVTSSSVFRHNRLAFRTLIFVWVELSWDGNGVSNWSFFEQKPTHPPIHANNSHTAQYLFIFFRPLPSYSFRPHWREREREWVSRTHCFFFFSRRLSRDLGVCVSFPYFYATFCYSMLKDRKTTTTRTEVHPSIWPLCPTASSHSGLGGVDTLPMSALFCPNLI